MHISILYYRYDRGLVTKTNKQAEYGVHLCVRASSVLGVTRDCALGFLFSIFILFCFEGWGGRRVQRSSLSLAWYDTMQLRNLESGTRKPETSSTRQSDKHAWSECARVCFVGFHPPGSPGPVFSTLGFGWMDGWTAGLGGLAGPWFLFC